MNALIDDELYSETKTIRPRVGIVMVTWNHWDVTSACLNSVFAMDYPAFEVIVVDNGSTDGTTHLLKENFPKTRVICNAGNLGFAAGCNIGFQAALEGQADYVLFLNNDTLTPVDFLEKLMSWAKSLPNVGIISPKIVFASDNNKTWFAGSRMNKWTLEADNFGPNGIRKTVEEGCRVVDYIFGTCMLVHRSVFEKVGMFDEMFFMYYEDMDLSLRVREAGFNLYCVPTPVLQHHVAASSREIPASRYYLQALSSVVFFRKHTHGLRYAIVVPYRSLSAIRTVTRLVFQRKFEQAKAYLQGIMEGLKLNSREKRETPS